MAEQNSKEESIQQYLVKDCSGMLKHAINNGKSVSPAVVSVVQAFQDLESKSEGSPSVLLSAEPEALLKLDQLVDAHDQLSKLVAPSTPESLRYLQNERQKKSPFRFLSEIGFIRQLWVAAIASLVLLLMFSMLEYVSFTSGEEVLDYTGFPILANLIFFMAAAGLGASIKELYEAQKYTSANTFEPKYMSSYWIRFTLGVTAGMVLASLIPLETSSESFNFLGKPTIAMLGGFNSSFVYKILNRMVESLENLVGSKTTEVKEIESKLEMVNEQYSNQQNRVNRYITEIQELVAGGADSDTIKKLLQKMTDKFIPPVDTKEPLTSASSTPVKDSEISEDEEKFRRFEYALEVKGPIEKPEDPV